MCISDGVIEYLDKNRLQNIPILTSISRGNAEVAAFDSRGVIIYDKVNDCYLVSADDNSIMDDFLEVMTSKYGVIALREANIAYVEKYKPTLRTAKCYQVVYTGEKMQERSIEGLTFSVLDISYTDRVWGIYSLKLDKDYITERLASGNVIGAFYKGNLAGFAGRHDEGSMGMLEVLPEYRRKSIASALLAKVINIILDSGEIPYSHILENNTASLALAKSINGMEICKEFMAWLIYE